MRVVDKRRYTIDGLKLEHCTPPRLVKKYGNTEVYEDEDGNQQILCDVTRTFICHTKE